MISKNFLSGIFSVVSFILITNLAIPSTFAQCPTDVSGTWSFKSRTDECGCSDPEDNGIIDFGSFVVAQAGDEISASWIDLDGDPEVLTGIVNGNSVYFKIEGTISDNPGCGWVNHAVGIIKGKKIKGLFTGEDTGDCDTCKWHGKFKFKIVK